MHYTDWNQFFADKAELLKPISVWITEERSRCKVYPAATDVFRFASTPLRDVKVVILGQDPYHGAGQADGLAFSVREGVKLPPSLKNIFRELLTDCGDAAVKARAGWGDGLDSCLNGDLSAWARQGVLLLNTALTVREGEAGSHLAAWQPFTDEVVRTVVDSSTVAPHFILWGSKAKATMIRCFGRSAGFWTKPSPLTALPHFAELKIIRRSWTTSTLVKRAISATYSAHPSPLSARGGFFGSRPFSRANLALRLNNPGVAGVEVDWRLP